MYKQTLPLLLLGMLTGSMHALAVEHNAVVVDKQNAIYWQDDTSVQKNTMDWHDANAYCNELTLNNFTQWRLPTFKELLYIVDFTRAQPAIYPAFKYVDNTTYWSATNFSATRSRAWTIDFRTGKSYYSYKTTNHNVRCVLDMDTKKEQK